jgi:putative ABC transport system permease protein
MFSNHLKIALRALKKNRVYTLINILGLTVGIASALLLFRIVNYELSFNKNFEKYERIVRVVGKEINPQGESDFACVPLPAMEEMENTVSQFESFTRIKEEWASITVPNPSGGAPLKKFSTEERETPLFVEQEFLDIFDFKILRGDRSSILSQPNSIVFTKKMAEKCFDNWESAIGETVLINNLVPVTVTGILKNLPANCDFSFPYLISYETVENNSDLFRYGGSWGSCSSNNQVYALLHSKDQLDDANDLIRNVGKEEYADDTGMSERFHLLQPISDLHYNENYWHSGTHQTNKSRLQILSFIGILILIIACFNFINLATAQANLRAKEVGVRKTLGSLPKQLIAQFMSETGVIVLISVILGANLASLSSPLLKLVSDVPDQEPFLSNPMVLLFLGIIAVVITLLAGLYPALVLSRFKPVEALKSKASGNTLGGINVRKALVVFQFVIAQALIIGAIIIINQLDYIQSRDLGFKKDLVYTFNFGSDSLTVARQRVLKNTLLEIPNVEKVSFSSDQPFSGNTMRSNFRYGTHAQDEPFGISHKYCDVDYLETYNIRLLAGRWLSPSDTVRQVVINVTTLEKLGITDPQEAIGQPLRIGGRPSVPIVGVAENFHTHNFRVEHEPLLMSTRKEYYWEAGLKVRPNDIPQTTVAIKQAFDRVLPEQVFNGRFLDERIARFYEDDRRLSDTCKGFGFLAILISCLGLFGLATHAAAQRIKEIGIRKVLGASLPGLIGLLSKDFLQLVLVALIVASPIAYYFMDTWLQNFVFRIDIQWQVFVIAGVLAILIAFVTVSFQSIKAALANPIEALKSE